MISNIILCYHRIGDPSSGGESLLCVDEEIFRSQLAKLRDRFSFVDLETLFSRGVRKSIAITFDDGYADNLHRALPTLEHFSAPATFFVATGYVDTKRYFLPDLLDVGLRTASIKPEVLRALKRYMPPVKLDDADYWGFHDQLRDLNRRDFEGLIDELSHLVGPSILESDPLRRPMTLPELKKLSQDSRVSIGPHTVNHRRIRSMSADDFNGELNESISALRNWGVKTSPFFACPYGTVTDFTDEQVDLASSLRFRFLSTTPIGLRPSAMSADGAIPRLCVQNWSPSKLLLIIWVCSMAAVMPRAWAFVRASLRTLRRSNSRRNGTDSRGRTHAEDD
jgi:peptidoglycan/xylan/chitin deacetylase (PgdA/CDA1 family)